MTLLDVRFPALCSSPKQQAHPLPAHSDHDALRAAADRAAQHSRQRRQQSHHQCSSHKPRPEKTWNKFSLFSPPCCCQASPPPPTAFYSSCSVNGQQGALNTAAGMEASSEMITVQPVAPIKHPAERGRAAERAPRELFCSSRAETSQTRNTHTHTHTWCWKCFSKMGFCTLWQIAL